MNKEIFKDMIVLRVIADIDNLHIYSQINEEHDKLVKEVLSRVQTCDLELSIDKGEFHESEIEFLGYMISDIGINIAQNKV
jgi:hypothetical protein